MLAISDHDRNERINFNRECKPLREVFYASELPPVFAIDLTNQCAPRLKKYQLHEGRDKKKEDVRDKQIREVYVRSVSS